MQPITISRTKTYTKLGHLRYYYEVMVPGERFAFRGHDIEWARGIARKYAISGQEVIENWKRS